MGTVKKVSGRIRRLHRRVVRNRHVRDFRAKYPRFSESLRKRFDREERYGLHVTIGALLTLFFMWLFFDVFEDLIGQESLIHSDLLILQTIVSFRRPILNEIMLFFTTLGNWQVIAMGLFLCSVYFFMEKRWHHLVALLVSVSGGSIFVHLLKQFVQRSRPPYLGALIYERTFSFPSGHSFVAFSFYGLLGYYIFLAVRRNRYRLLITGLGGVVVLLVGFSRIYLGVHWPSDVLAGYASGAAWLTVHITALESYPNRPHTPFLNRQLSHATAIILFLVWSLFVARFYSTHPLMPAVQAIGYQHESAKQTWPERALKWEMTSLPGYDTSGFHITRKSEMKQHSMFPSSPSTNRTGLRVSFLRLNIQKTGRLKLH